LFEFINKETYCGNIYLCDFNLGILLPIILLLSLNTFTTSLFCSKLLVLGNSFIINLEILPLLLKEFLDKNILVIHRVESDDIFDITKSHE